MNKKGFTLVELLAVVLVLGILSLIAVPNVISIVDNNKKDTMLSDARKLISQAKYQVNIDSELGIRYMNTYDFDFDTLNAKNDIKSDPDGGAYNKTQSYVRYQKDVNGLATYCVYLVGSSKKVATDTNGCVLESNLFDRSNVREN